MGVILITILYTYFVSLETTISSGNMNASVVACQDPQIYNFSLISI